MKKSKSFWRLAPFFAFLKVSRIPILLRLTSVIESYKKFFTEEKNNGMQESIAVKATSGITKMLN